MKTQRRQTGFTLIEMIAVIVILGILAAVALPKFMGMSTDARMAKMNGAAGAMSSAAVLFHSKWLANQAAVAQNTSIEGYKLTKDPVQGYPAKEDIAGLAGLRDTDFGGTTTGAVTDLTYTTCALTYTEAKAADAKAGTAATPAEVGTGGITTANCGG